MIDDAKLIKSLIKKINASSSDSDDGVVENLYEYIETVSKPTLVDRIEPIKRHTYKFCSLTQICGGGNKI